MIERKNHLICPQGHYVWLGQLEVFMADPETKEGVERIYFCHNCCYVEAPWHIGLYRVGQVTSSGH